MNHLINRKAVSAYMLSVTAKMPGFMIQMVSRGFTAFARAAETSSATQLMSPNWWLDHELVAFRVLESRENGYSQLDHCTSLEPSIKSIYA